MPLPITEIDDFCEASFGGYSALFTEERIDRASLPEGIYAMTYGAERVTISERSNLVLRSTIRERS